jgi:hypothetical protein
MRSQIQKMKGRFFPRLSTVILAILVMACVGGAEEDVRASAPLLSQQRNINVVKGESDGSVGEKDGPEEEELDGTSVVAESVDANPRSSNPESDGIAAAEGTVDTEEDSEDVEAAKPVPVYRKASAKEQRLETWLLGESGDKVILRSTEITKMNRAWVGEKAKTLVPKDFSRNEFRKMAFRDIEKPCEDERCSARIEKVLNELGVGAVISEEGELSTGSFRLDLSDVSDPEEKLRLLDAAAKRGPTLIQTPQGPGIYLGRSSSPGGGARALMAKPQESNTDTVGTPRLEVIELKGGGAPGSPGLLSQLGGASTFAPAAGPELAGVVTLRPALPLVETGPKKCRRRKDTSVYVFPSKPSNRSSVRLVTLVERDPGPYEVAVIGPKKKPVPFSLSRSTGPPFSVIATLKNPKPGNYQMRVGEGDDLFACKNFQVSRNARSSLSAPDDAVWTPRRRWNQSTENLYATFVETLLDYPLEDDQTWTSLQQLIDNSEKNLLHNYLGHNEDDKLAMVPDCADLPYFLRAYFAWKMKLPFAYRKCSGGYKNHPPKCEEELHTPAFVHGKKNSVQAFRAFLRQLASGVHSGNARTAPTDSLTDLYPVDLTHDALRPGTVFADPYGHLLVLSKWVGQPKGSYGILMAGDAQPF